MMRSIEEKTGRKASCRNHLMIILAAICIGMLFMTAFAAAVSVPGIKVDPACTSIKDAEEAVVTGTVSKAKGQAVMLYASDKKTVLGQTVLGLSGKAESFRLPVPDERVKRPGQTTVYVKSLQNVGVSASKLTAVRIQAMKSQSISAPDSVTLTNLKTTQDLKAKATSGLDVTYSSSDPKVVKVNSSGKITRVKNGQATITISQKGNGTYLSSEKTVSIKCRKSTKKEQIDGAVAWAVKIANNNSFTYGSGRGAHHNGCYFCGTNYGPRKYMKPSKKYKKTYCCNPFIHAAYAHGAQHPKMLAGCRKASGIGMEKSTFYKFKCWKCVGKPAYKKLQKGDVLVKSNHVAMYIGNHKLVESSGGTWSAKSIAVKHMSGSRYRQFSYVMRYTGY